MCHLTSCVAAEAVRADVLRGPWRADSYEPLQLETLDLSYNELHSLPRKALEHLPRLLHLRLDGNPLRVLDHSTQDALAGAPGLQVTATPRARDFQRYRVVSNMVAIRVIKQSQHKN